MSLKSTRTGNMREGAEAREASIEAEYKAKADLETATRLDVKECSNN